MIAIATKASTPMSSGSGTIDKPTGLQEGEVMIAILTAPAPAQGGSISQPGGWTEVSNPSVEYTQTKVYKKVATATDETVTATYNFAGALGGIIYRLTDASFDRVQTSGSSLPSANSIILLGAASGDNDSDIGTFSGYTATGGVTITFTEDFDSGYALGLRYSMGVASAPYASQTNITGASVTVGGGVDQQYQFMVVIGEASAPTVTTQAVSAIDVTTATGNGNITNTGGATPDERGIVLSTTSHGDPGNTDPDASDYELVFSDTGSYSTGAFTKALTGLDPETTYYARAYAKNTIGFAYGSEVTFDTLAPDPATVDTQAATLIKSTSALGNAEITDNGGQNATEVGFVLATSAQSDPGDTAPGASTYDLYFSKSGSFGVTAFSVPCTNLEPGTTYYMRAYALNGGGYSYGDEVTFATDYAPPVITEISPAGALLDTAESITITGSGFRAGCTVEIDGETCTSIVVVDENTITCDVPASATPKESILLITNDDAQDGSFDFFYIEGVAPTPQPGAVSASFSVKGVAYLN